MDFLEQLIAKPQQGTTEWKEERLGKFTSSEIHRLLTPVFDERPMTEAELEARPKKGEGSRTTIVRTENLEKLSSGAFTYVLEKVAEEITGCYDEVISRETDWGQTYEPKAKECYEETFGKKVYPAFFVPLSRIAGGSPDGYTSDGDEVNNSHDCDIVIEIKCPYNTINFLKFLLMSLHEFIEEHFDYYCQIQMNMLVSKRKKGRIVYYDPRMPEGKQIKVMDIPQDIDLQNRIVKKIEAAAKLKTQYLTILNMKNNYGNNF